MSPVANLSSIAESGILSHTAAENVPHMSVASASVQDLRVGKRVPGDRLLHDYVNLYLDARNAMMYQRRSRDLVVLRITSDALDLPGAIVTNGNAASHDTLFYESPSGLVHLVEEEVYAEYWTDSDYFEYLRKKRKRQAELLIPDKVEISMILGCYTWHSSQVPQCLEIAPQWEVAINAHVFFG